MEVVGTLEDAEMKKSFSSQLNDWEEKEWEEDGK